ncbi:MAG: glycosyltransferase [Bacteroidales bacterium]
MNFTIVTHATHKKTIEGYYSYGPYVREMNIWIRYTSKVVIVAPLHSNEEPGPIDLKYNHSFIEFISIPEFDILTIKSFTRTLFVLPVVIFRIIWAIKRADHVHLRCPGNVGLLGSIIQIFFPKKRKTAKYAGNWDPDMLKISTNNLQRAILSSERLSRNMSVLVYGEWPNQTKNIISFFTASYSKNEIVDLPVRNLTGRIKCIYCGFLLKDKRPLQSIKVVEYLRGKGFDIELAIVGDGPERNILKEYILQNNLESFIQLLGNVPALEVKLLMQQSHFLTFFGHDNEGWPKVVAEAMFWGCVPLVRSVSCTPYMLGYGERGTIVEDSVDSMANGIIQYLKDPVYYKNTAEKAMQWSRRFTLELFEEKIRTFMT